MKIFSLELLAGIAAEARVAGKRVVHCHGVFDVPHVGHIKHLREARGFGDVLVVTITPDHHVGKGPGRPIFPAELRAEALAGLGCVDYVGVNRWPTAVDTIWLLRPSLFVKGPGCHDDRSPGFLAEMAAIRAVGGDLVYTTGDIYSSTQIIEKLKEGG